MKIVGIDPGLKGAVAIMEGPKALTIVRMPVCEKKSGKGEEVMWDHLADDILHLIYEADHAFLEAPGVRPKQSAQAGSFQGFNAGVPLGMLVAYRVPRTIVPAHVWKMDMGLSMAGGATTTQKKKRSLLRAAEIWPERREEFKNTSGDDGAAEAALLAYWGYKKLMKEMGE